MAHVYGWEESVGEALGASRRTIHRDLELFRLVIEPFPGMAEALSKHPVVGENGKQLRDIAQVRDEAARKAVIEALLEDEELSVDEAKVRLGIGLTGAANAATPVAYQKYFNQIEGGWSRLGTAEKRQFLPKLASMLPAEMKRDLRDRLNQELGDNTPPRPRKVGVEQASSTLADMIGAINRLLDGGGVDDDELNKLRQDAQAVIFDIPETAHAR